jgi:hypothetical protein
MCSFCEIEIREDDESFEISGALTILIVTSTKLEFPDGASRLSDLHSEFPIRVTQEILAAGYVRAGGISTARP